MLNFLLIMLIPTIIAIGFLHWAKDEQGVTIWEALAQIVVVGLIAGIGLGIAYYQGTTDKEIWNGMVVNRRAHVPVPCEHSYSCYCHQVCTGSGKDRSCTTECDTCYEHNCYGGSGGTCRGNDFSWYVDASTGETTEINRIDRQGNNMPPRWGSSFLGEPYSSEHRYTNYIKANPESVLIGSKGDIEHWKSLIPKYPDSVYDYYKHISVLNMGIATVDTNTWNWLLREINKKLGPTKQVNILVILVPTNDSSYTLALKDAWLGGKKNDVDVIIGSKDGHTIDFVDVMSWSTNKSMAVDLRNHINDIGTLDNRKDSTYAIYTIVNKEFVRMHMKDMKWLMRSFQPSHATMTWLFIIAILAEGLMVGGFLYYNKNKCKGYRGY